MRIEGNCEVYTVIFNILIIICLLPVKKKILFCHAPSDLSRLFIPTFFLQHPALLHLLRLAPSFLAANLQRECGVSCWRGDLWVWRWERVEASDGDELDAV